MKNTFIDEITPSYKLYRDMASLQKNGRIVKLCSNESPLGTNLNIVLQLKNKLNTLHLYPDPEASTLKYLVSKKEAIKENQIVFGNGSTEIIELIIQEMLGENISVIMSEYTYPLYKMLGQRIKAKIIEVPQKQWEYDLDGIVDAILSNTKIIFITNPNNPTGTWASYNQLSSFLLKIPPSILVVIDEAYYEYMKCFKGYKSAVGLLDKFENLIVTRTFSKAYGLAGLRLGYAMANADIINKLKLRKQSANVNIVAQYAGELALVDSAYLNKVICEVKNNMSFLQESLNDLGIKYIPTKTNFLLINVKSAEEAYKKLFSHNIIVQPMTFYRLPNYIRVSIGTRQEMSYFITKIKECNYESNTSKFFC